MTASTDLVLRDDQTMFDDLQVAALRQIGVDGASNADLAVFFHTCKRTGLDPFARQVYMIRRGGKQTMQTGIDGLRLVAQRTAERTRETFGYEDTMWADESGVWHDVWLSSTPPAAAKVAVVRNGQRFPAVAMFKEYAQTSPNWREKPALMLAKCAEAAALRKAFPMDLSGIYTPDEVHDEAPAAPTPQFRPAQQSAPADDDTEEAVVVDEPDTDAALPGVPLTKTTRGHIFALFAELYPEHKDDAEKQREYFGWALKMGGPIRSRADLNEEMGARVLDALKAEKLRRDIDDVQQGRA